MDVIDRKLGWLDMKCRVARRESLSTMGGVRRHILRNERLVSTGSRRALMREKRRVEVRRRRIIDERRRVASEIYSINRDIAEMMKHHMLSVGFYDVTK